MSDRAQVALCFDELRIRSLGPMCFVRHPVHLVSILRLIVPSDLAPIVSAVTALIDRIIPAQEIASRRSHKAFTSIMAAL
jgi:hypothetical protein